ncbi:jacalin-related lectin 19 isoform X2 [Elaeis guineensis]|uniref:Jacalin-related lectin 19 isoform X2 n=1 Tax=Elaeis guineensis var. tenera TaxID=51953 RepID=A0A6I9RF17_ELAGV|nr:jacalin-related lectin 19 isoform X2 [Elaeis guineensis]
MKKLVGSSKTVKVGPWGGHGGNPWDDGSYNGVREITLVYDRCIDSIRVLYDKNGKPVLAEKHGGNGGNLTVQVKLHYPEEFLTCVSGHYSPVVHGGSPVIRSLTFKSNQRAFGPFGVEEGTPFTFPMDGGMIVGFSGRGGWYLDAIGLCLSPIRTAGLYDTVQQKLQKFGNLATKRLGNRYGEHGSRANARTQKAYA